MKFELLELLSKIKPNHILVPGLVLFSFLLICDFWIGPHFEIRNLFVAKLFHNVEISLLFLSTCAILGGALLKPGWFKWFLITPFIFVFLGVLIIVFFNVFIPASDDLLVKRDEVLYVNTTDSRIKVVRQEYMTGIAGGNYHEDTLVVFQFSSWLRTIEKFNKNNLDGNWKSLVTQKP